MQNLHVFDNNDGNYSDIWQFTSNICGLKEHELENITFNNIDMTLDGGVDKFEREVPIKPSNPYPEAYVYGRILPASGLYFRYVKNLSLDNIKIKTIRPDKRDPIVKE